MSGVNSRGDGLKPVSTTQQLMSQALCSPSGVQKLGSQSWAQFAQKRRLVCPRIRTSKLRRALLLYFSVKRPQLWNRGFRFPSARKLSLIQLQANKLLHALPVLHLSRAVSVILTCLAVGSLRLSHLLVHLCQTQSRKQVEGKKVDESQLKLQLRDSWNEPTVTPGGSNCYFSIISTFDAVGLWMDSAKRRHVYYNANWRQ